MDIKEAFEIVLSLASDAVLEDKDVLDNEIGLEVQHRQSEAIEMVHKYVQGNAKLRFVTRSV